MSPASLDVVDSLQARGDHIARVRLHFAPGIHLVGGGREWRVLEGARQVARVHSRALDWIRSDAPYHPEFGLEVGRLRLTATVPFSNRVSTEFSISFA